MSSQGSHQMPGEDSICHIPTIEAFPPPLGFDSHTFLGSQGCINPGPSEYPLAQSHVHVVQPHSSIAPWAQVAGNAEAGDVQYVPPIFYQTAPLHLENMQGGGEQHRPLQGIWTDRIHRLL